MAMSQTETDTQSLKDAIKQANARATASKLDLHDLAEDLPQGWEQIMATAERTYQAYRHLAELKATLANQAG
jgi:hypothetical protein